MVFAGLLHLCIALRVESFVELGVAMIVASTLVSAVSNNRLSVSSVFTSSNICAVSGCSSSKWRKRRIVDSSGTVSSPSYTRAKQLIDSESYNISSASGLDSSDHCCRKWIRSILSSGSGRRPEPGHGV